MTKRGRSTVSAVLLLASLPLILYLTFLTSPAASSEREVATLAQEACAANSVPALVQGRPRCLRVGQKCKRTLDPTFHRYAFHCHKGRLARPTSFAMRVNVGGHRLAISCRGKGRPTVILESGAGTSSFAWVVLAPKVAKTTRVCSYDRAGLGDSEPRRPPGPVPAARVVEDLHVLLAGAGIAPPYVLGGWSLGGFFIRLYAKRYPAEVVGLVGVDGTPFGIPGDPGPEPTRPAAHRSHRRARDLRLLLLRSSRSGTRGLAGSRLAAARPADARSPRLRPGRPRGDVGAMAEAGRTLLDIFDTRPRRSRRSQHPVRSTLAHRRSFPTGDHGRSRECSTAELRQDAAIPSGRNLP